MLEELKDKIEKSVVALATVKDSKPHQIAVAAVKVSEDKVIITNNFMEETIENLKTNNQVSLIFWKEEGYELRGTAEYHSEGKWLDFVKNLEENKEFNPKGAIVVTVNKTKI